jgi:hypothetical protein
MRMLRWSSAFAALVLLATPVLAGDVTGKWVAEFDSQIGVQKYTYELAVDGDKLTGKASFERMGEKGVVDLTEGKVEGDTVSFVEPLEFQGNSIRIEYKGTLKGDEIHFTRNVGEFATEEIVARRLKD